MVLYGIAGDSIRLVDGDAHLRCVIWSLWERVGIQLIDNDYSILLELIILS